MTNTVMLEQIIQGNVDYRDKTLVFYARVRHIVGLLVQVLTQKLYSIIVTKMPFKLFHNNLPNIPDLEINKRIKKKELKNIIEGAMDKEVTEIKKKLRIKKNLPLVEVDKSGIYNNKYTFHQLDFNIRKNKYINILYLLSIVTIRRDTISKQSSSVDSSESSKNILTILKMLS
ncbi:hypothetical protein AGLY_013413 [Aphis glycines]|uniref:Uncharacterized protein n=1 Tax=Aphis glycines TaxID=307491 RepID=A0A6G0T8E0_APHGL|nr:hypothetical protein AGLY_013413 [Aphis glycines]